MPTEEYYLDSFLEMISITRGLSKNTLDAYGRDITTFLAIYPKIKKVQQKHISKYMHLMAKKGASKGTQARHLSTIRQFFKYMLEKKVIKTDPTKNISMPKLPKNLPKALSILEIEKLFKFCAKEKDLRLKAILEILYSTGIRVSELTALKVSDIDMGEGKFIQIMDGKGGKARLVPLGERAAETLGAYMVKSRPKYNKNHSEWLFPSPHGTALTRQRMFQLIQNIGKKAGLMLTPHILRHSFATHMLMGQADLRSLQLMLGHVDVSTTEGYTKVVDDKLQYALEVFHPLNINKK